MGISASVGLTLFLFGLNWDVIQTIQGDVTVVREDIAYIRGSLDAYWFNNTG